MAANVSNTVNASDRPPWTAILFVLLIVAVVAAMVMRTSIEQTTRETAYANREVLRVCLEKGHSVTACKGLLEP